ncbi:MAG: segregation/condensation protein A [Acidobacteria bacterium]|nr:segregation/condensation protein A [Acidobacteriota bacterium]MBU4307943.1 segregation/condensation protein A [Acidobacteriota bacterium]MCG2811807.1 segregation/condensation protein A [Candidatus Aminicenantes bacterium]
MEIEISNYQVQTDFFEGPLDLLLHLIRKNKMKIVEIRLSQITAEYLAYLENKKGINPSRESDFLTTAATLIYIKSRSLLPKPEDPAEESPEKKLIHTLIEYEKIQKISKMLQDMEYTELLLWRRLEIDENFTNREYALKEVSAFQLAEIFFDIIKKKENEQFLYISSKNYSIAEKLEEISVLLKKNVFIDFSAYMSKLDSIEEILVSFFTLLEMIKRHLLIAVQEQLFGAISIYPNQVGRLEN